MSLKEELKGEAKKIEKKNNEEVRAKIEELSTNEVQKVIPTIVEKAKKAARKGEKEVVLMEIEIAPIMREETIEEIAYLEAMKIVQEYCRKNLKLKSKIKTKYDGGGDFGGSYKKYFLKVYW